MKKEQQPLLTSRGLPGRLSGAAPLAHIFVCQKTEETKAQGMPTAQEGLASGPALLVLASGTDEGDGGSGVDQLIVPEEVLRWARTASRRLVEAVAHPQRDVVVVALDAGLPPRDVVLLELAVWLAGYCVCPIDLEHDPRAPAMIEQVNACLVVSRPGSKHHIEAALVGVRWISPQELLSPSTSSEAGVLCFPVGDWCASNSLSHVIFTSGSTGRPKPVAVRFSSLFLFASLRARRSFIDSTSRIFLSSAFTFDPSLGDLASALVTSCTLILPPRCRILNGELGAMVRQHGATHLTTTPSTLSLAGNLSDLTCLHELLIGGERLRPEMVRALIEAGIPLICNTYGVTEATVYQTSHRIGQLGDEGLLGDAYEPGIRYMLVRKTKDANCIETVVNVGCEGEICLVGDMLGVGYMGHDPLQQGGFQILSCNGAPPARFYLTGDLARVTNRGVEIIGRADSQIKVNGMRIEPGEVEAALVASTFGLVQARPVVLLDGNRKLSALCPLADSGLPIGPVPRCVAVALRTCLEKALPGNMVPKRFAACALPLPVTTNGKLDTAQLRALLDAPESGNLENEEALGGAEALVTRTERVIGLLWGQALGLPKWEAVHRSDSFTGLGGDSLSALKSIASLLRLLRDSTHPAVVHAQGQARTNGEISGLFSVVWVLTCPCLRDYARAFDDAGVELVDEAHNLVKHADVAVVEISKHASHDDVFAADDVNEGDGVHQPVGPLESAAVRALHDAARMNLPSTVRALVRGGGLSPDGLFVRRTRMCRTPLHDAACAGAASAVRMLLELSANPLPTTLARVCPLHLACTSPSVETVELLMAVMRSSGRCLDPTLVEDKNGQTALFYAARSGHCAVAALLLKSEVPPNTARKRVKARLVDSIDRWGRTPLHWAVVNNHLDMARLLLDRGAAKTLSSLKPGTSMKGTHLVQETPLQLAIRRGSSVEMIEMLGGGG